MDAARIDEIAENPALSLAGLLCLALALFPSSAGAWGSGHRVITRAAVEVMPEALLSKWAKPHRHPFSGEEKSIADWLSERFCSHPDWVDGPSRTGTDIEDRVSPYHVWDGYVGEREALEDSLADDWKNKGGSAETDRYLSEVAKHNAKLVADVFFTAWKLAEAPGEE